MTGGPVVVGAAWVFGDDINTDVMAPGLYFKSSMAEMARHCLEAVNPEFASSVKPGDIVVAGRNFGIGSAREQAAMAFQYLGVGAILAQSFGRIFYRNSINFGIPTLVFNEVESIEAGDSLMVDAASGAVTNRTRGVEGQAAPLSGHLLTLVRAGGLMPYLHGRLAAGE